MEGDEEEFIKAVQEGISQADAAELIEHEEVAAYLRSLTTDTPLPHPEPKTEGK